MEAIKDASHLYEVEHRAQHAARPGFRIQELRQKVRLQPGETFTAGAKRPHLVTNGGEKSVSFLVLQGVGDTTMSPW